MLAAIRLAVVTTTLRIDMQDLLADLSSICRPLPETCWRRLAWE
jgi:hypothetical protein